MNKNNKRIFRTALVAAALAAPALAADGLRYTTNCAVVEANSVDGFVSNQSADTYKVYGEVKFIFTPPGSMSRPAVLVQVDSLIPGGESARVARARLAFMPMPGETCRFDVSGQLRKM